MVVVVPVVIFRGRFDELFIKYLIMSGSNTSPQSGYRCPKSRYQTSRNSTCARYRFFALVFSAKVVVHATCVKLLQVSILVTNWKFHKTMLYT